MRLSRALEEKLMDVRLRDKLVTEGKLTKDQVDKYLAAIPDETKNSVYTADVESDEEEEEE
jgi:polyhydroxyalkanoate synthesis regulator phasin